MTEELVQKALDGDRRALPRLFTLLERDPLSCGEIMKSIHPLTGRAHCVGVTGPPGAGKSTLVDGLVRLYREAGVSVGVLAVDPTSPFTGGAVLGDRVRMRRHYLDEGVFIRSIATRGWHGGLSLGASAAVRLLDAFGMDVVIVESVGVGQTELDIMNVADTVVVVLVPEAGDAVQMLKAGLMEAADIFVVNKADRPNADSMAAVIGAEVAHGSAGAWWIPPVLMTKAHRAQGLQELSEAIAGHLERSRSTSNLERRRSGHRREEFIRLLLGELEQRLSNAGSADGEIGRLVEDVQSGRTDPYSAAYAAIADWGPYLFPRPPGD